MMLDKESFLNPHPLLNKEFGLTIYLIGSNDVAYGGINQPQIRKSIPATLLDIGMYGSVRVVDLLWSRHAKHLCIKVREEENGYILVFRLLSIEEKTEFTGSLFRSYSVWTPYMRGKKSYMYKNVFLVWKKFSWFEQERRRDQNNEQQ